jgi:poly(3-hydroxybutyrate) depolymerase
MRFSLLLLLAACGGGGGGSDGDDGGGSSGTPAPSGSVGPYTYQLYVPVPRTGAMLIAMHGTGGHGGGMIDLWRAPADSQGFMILAPNYGDNGTYFEPAGEAAIWQMVDQIDAQYTVDRKRIYLNGVSTGGSWSFVFGLTYSDQVAAASVFAGGYTGDNDLMVSTAAREIPYYLSHGVDDATFPVENARSARDALAGRGHPVVLDEHGYGHGVRPGSPADAWTFLSPFALP